MQLCYQDQNYRWNGKVWLDQHFFQVSQKLADELTDRFLHELVDPTHPHWIEQVSQLGRAGKDLDNRSTLRLVARACRARLQRYPEEAAAVAILSSALRQLGQSAQAEEVTRHWLNPAVLTSRSAALCDLGRWQEALSTVQLALRSGAGAHALEVRQRIVTYLAASGRSA